VRRFAFLALLPAAALASSARADEAPPVPAPPSSDEQLRAEVARQGAAIEELKAALEKERKDDGAKAPSSLPVRISGFVQADWIIHDQQSQDEVNGSTGQPLNQDRFMLRRGHVRLDAEKGFVLGALELDANTTNGLQVRPIDAEVSLRWPAKPDARLPSLVATMGLMRVPFGGEVQELDYVRPFLERSTMFQALFPGELDLGVRLKMKYRPLDLAIGAMNGSLIGNKVFPALDPVHAKDVVGRVGVDFDIVRGVHLQAGVSGDVGTGFHAGTPATMNQLVWQDQNGDGLVEPNEIVAIGGAPATPSQTFRRFAVGGDARLTVRIAPVGDLSLRAEIVSAVNLDRGLEVADPVGAGHDLREVGWSVGVTQELTKWAMIGARYDAYDPDADASQQRAANLVPVDRTYWKLALMGMFRYEQARLLLEYDLDGNPLGIGPNGAPTSLAANALTLRGQLVF